jgi:predicted transcriptional regulator of viral defense system
LDDYRYVRHWVDDLPKRGRLSFSLDEVKQQFPDLNGHNVLKALHRLSVAGKAHSVWRGFYAIVLPDYGLSGDVPPVEYIDQLMAYLQTEYYIALLSAASYQGASHQSPQVFQVMCGKQMRPKSVGGSRLEFSYKGKMPRSGIEEKLVRGGAINVSSPALTALDLVGYSSRAGGINNVAAVLTELADSIDFGTLNADLLNNEPKATVQRLGHLLEVVIEEKQLADNLHDLCKQSGLKFNMTELVPGHSFERRSIDRKWKVAVNYDVEVAE